MAHLTKLLRANAKNLSGNCIKDFFSVTRPAVREALMDYGDYITVRQTCLHLDFERYQSTGPLSHCWGPNIPGNKLLLTTRSNYADQCQQVPWEELSITFKHALQITRCLGVEYIWIDSLYIVQDDYADWKTEAAKMQYVYSDACPTLFASGSADRSGGCLF